MVNIIVRHWELFSRLIFVTIAIFSISVTQQIKDNVQFIVSIDLLCRI